MKKIEDLRLTNARLLTRRFDTLAEFANTIDRSATQVSRLIGKNPTKSIGSRMARHIELTLQLPEGWLDTVHTGVVDKSHDVFADRAVVTQSGDDSYIQTLSRVGRYPLIDKVQAGSWSEMTEEYLADAPTFPCPISCSEATFLLKVSGDSMLPIYQDGYFIWVDPSVEPQNKSHVIARLDDNNEATFKQLVIEDEQRFLKPLNKNWPEQYIKINDNCTIIGVVIFGGFVPI
ncbi:S24 family peptidase [Photobacterium frigidiphilum]|uniref:LexA family protein n=1 Tax=Photobacterium frigidiphilum TaxID=264736 RepID=UPI003D115BC8